MLRPPHAAVVVLSTLMVALVAGSAAGEVGWKPIMLKGATVGISNIIPAPGGRGAVGIPITNNSDGAVWIAMTLRPPTPAQETVALMTLEAKQDTVVRCPQDAFAEGDYVISVAVFADSSSRDTLESGSTSTRLDKKDVKSLEEWLRASTLPKTFKHVEKVAKVTAGTTLSGMFGAPKGDGTLTVDASGVTYTKKKESLVIPASALRDVGLNNANPQQPWVVVSYELNGEKKSVSFKPNVYRGDAGAPQIAVAIQSAMWGSSTEK